MITISAGIGASTTRETSQYPTAGAVLRCQNLRAILGFGDNVEAVVNGSRAEHGTSLQDGDRVLIQNRANDKGA